MDIEVILGKGHRSQVYFFSCADQVRPLPEAGVPQGSVISPILHNSYLNKLALKDPTLLQTSQSECKRTQSTKKLSLYRKQRDKLIACGNKAMLSRLKAYEAEKETQQIYI